MVTSVHIFTGASRPSAVVCNPVQIRRARVHATGLPLSPECGTPRSLMGSGASRRERVAMHSVAFVHSGGDERAQHVLQDAAVAEVVRLAGGVDADHRVELDGGAVLLHRGDRDCLRDATVVQGGDAGEGEGLRAVQAQRLGGLPLGELQREDTQDRKSTRLNSSHVKISYAVFCLKKKT